MTHAHDAEPQQRVDPAGRPPALPTGNQALQFVVELAEALTRPGTPEGLVQHGAGRIAEVYGVPRAHVVVLPNFTLAAQEKRPGRARRHRTERGKSPT